MTSSNPYPRGRVLLMGIIAGAVYGLVAAYFYARAHEEDLKHGDPGANRVQTSEIITVIVAALAMIRQIAEMGRAPKRARRR
jgi:H+/Cl- antiporter ClcA